MSALLVTILLFLAFCAMVLAILTRRSVDRLLETSRHRAQAVRDAAGELELDFHGTLGGRIKALATGKLGRFDVNLRAEEDEQGRRTVIELKGVPVRRVTLRKAQRLTGLGRLRTGDADLDATVHVWGPADRTPAMLTPRVRAAAIRAVGGGATLEGGALSWSSGGVPSGALLVSAVRALHELAEALVEGRQIADRQAGRKQKGELSLAAGEELRGGLSAPVATVGGR